MMSGHRTELPESPLMHAFSEPLMQATIDKRYEDFQFFLYGRAAALSCEMPAAELTRRLVDGARSLLSPP
jgi:hypothetical protein